MTELARSLINSLVNETMISKGNDRAKRLDGWAMYAVARIAKELELRIIPRVDTDEDGKTSEIDVSTWKFRDQGKLIKQYIGAKILKKNPSILDYKPGRAKADKAAASIIKKVTQRGNDVTIFWK